MTQANAQIHTELNRYPLLFGNTWALRNKLMGPSIKILSFGCSTGEELLSLRSYFPNDTLYGCDINEGALQMAREQTKNIKDVNIFFSNNNNLEQHAPYDLIFANSVLCINTNNPKALREKFPFPLFEKIIVQLASLLHPAGILALFNTSYYASDSSSFSEMVKPIRSHFITPGYVPRFDRDSNLLLDRTVINGRGFYKEVARQTRDVADHFDVIYSPSGAVSDHRLDYSRFDSWVGIDPPLSAAELKSSAISGLVVDKILFHLSSQHKVDSLHITAQSKNCLGTHFLPQVLCRFPGAPEGFMSLSRY